MDSLPGSASVSRADSLYQSSDVGSSTPATAKKRKIRHSRVKTGCRDCRTRRIKCSEGQVLSPGVKLPCVKCDETGTECWYPAPDDTGRTTTRWVIAAQVDAQGRIVPRPAGEATEMVVKREESDSGDPGERLVKHEYHPPPLPFYSDPKLEPSPTYYTNSPVQPYFVAPDPPFPGPSLGHTVYAESALRNTTQMPGPSSGIQPKTYSSVPLTRAEPGITLPRIPKGIGTIPAWQPIDHHTHPGPFAYASPVYGDPGTGSSRTPFTSFSSASASDTSHLAYMMPIMRQAQADPEFNLRLTRMPWVRRKPMHVDYTRSRNAPAKNTAKSSGETYDFVDNLHRYLNNVNQPVRPLQTFTLASLSDSPLKRTALSYFETRGCGEIIAVGEMKSNWIYVQLFPRVYDLLSGESGHREGIRVKHEAGGSMVAGHAAAARHYTCEFVHHSLIRLSCVHRANTERDPERIHQLRREIQAHGKRAMLAGLTVRIQCPEKWWKTEEYL